MDNFLPAPFHSVAYEVVQRSRQRSVGSDAQYSVEHRNFFWRKIVRMFDWRARQLDCWLILASLKSSSQRRKRVRHTSLRVFRSRPARPMQQSHTRTIIQISKITQKLSSIRATVHAVQYATVTHLWYQ